MTNPKGYARAYEDLQNDVIRVSENVGAGVSGVSEYVVKAPCTLEKTTVRFFTGCQLNLRLDPYIVKAKHSRKDIIRYVGKEYVDGDNEILEYKNGIPLDPDDVLKVAYTNMSAADAFDFVVTFELDYLNGPMRLDLGVGK